MQAIIQILTVTIKELRELLHRPMLVLTLILGPLAILIVFGMGSNARPSPPSAIVVLPPGQKQPRLLQDYGREFNQFLNIAGYTDDEAFARAQLRRKVVDAVLILPASPFETITQGKPATIKVLYNEIDPIWRGLVPQFVQALTGEINREIFLQNAGQQRVALTDAVSDIDVVLRGLNQAITASNRADWQETRRQVQDALAATNRLAEILMVLGPEAAPLHAQVERARTQLQEVDQFLTVVESATGTPTPGAQDGALGLIETRRSLQALRDALNSYTTVPPEVVIAPLAIQTEQVARLEPDVITFFAPAILALLLQHVAVSLGALALVRERLSGTFDLYVVAPISNLGLLLGKYVAYMLFTLGMTAVLLAVLLLGLHVPVFGSFWRLGLTLLLLTLASVGVGLAFSLLATSERQAVQFSMLSLLSIMFFSGFVLPLDALRQPALSVSYALPATYGVVLLQDVMLRGLPGSNGSLLILAAIAATLFAACFGLLHWRTRAH
jgi:ABC-2 type transport system permease protein